MVNLFDSNAPKKPTNLTVNSDLLSKAKDLKINISAVLEIALAETLIDQKRKQWIKDNAQSIDGYNDAIKNFGIFSDSLRSF
jgi:antitoxin CcdA